MRKTIVLGLLAVALGSSCTVVAPGNPDGGKNVIKPFPIALDALPPPKPLEASVLIVANLERSSVNMADRYAEVITRLGGFLTSVGLKTMSMGLIATYGDHYGPRLLLGRREGAPTSPSLSALIASGAADNIQDYDDLLPRIGGVLGNISEADLPIALRLLAASGNFDGDGETSEAKNLIAFGRGLGGEALSPVLGGIERSALFDKPRDLFIIIYLQSLPRRCALDSPACLVDGRKPTDIFLETDAAGAAAWLNFAGPGIKPAQLLHVAIATSETESLAAFRTRCGEVPGFPRTLFDVMAPSQNAYFGPLTAALSAAHRGTGAMGDLCELIGASPEEAIKKLGTSVAGVLGPATAKP
jgi:hypothetical protein